MSDQTRLRGSDQAVPVLVIQRVISVWPLILQWGLIGGVLGFGIAGAWTLMVGWRFPPADQWHAVNWGATYGMITGAVVGVRRR